MRTHELDATRVLRSNITKIVGLLVLLTAATLVLQPTLSKDEPEKEVPFKDVGSRLVKYKADLRAWLKKIQDDYTSPAAPSYENDRNPDHTRQVFDHWRARVLDAWRRNGGSGDVPENFAQQLRGELSAIAVLLPEGFLERHVLRLALDEAPTESVAGTVGGQHFQTCLECTAKASDVAKVDEGMKRLEEFDTKLHQMFDEVIDLEARREVIGKQQDAVQRRASEAWDQLNKIPRDCSPARPECITTEEFQARIKAFENEQKQTVEENIRQLQPLNERVTVLKGSLRDYISETDLFDTLEFKAKEPKPKIYIYARTATGLQYIDEFYLGVPTIVEAQFDPPNNKAECQVEVSVGEQQLKLTAKRIDDQGIIFRTDPFIPTTAKVDPQSAWNPNPPPKPDSSGSEPNPNSNGNPPR